MCFEELNIVTERCKALLWDESTQGECPERHYQTLRSNGFLQGEIIIGEHFAASGSLELAHCVTDRSL